MQKNTFNIIRVDAQERKAQEIREKRQRELEGGDLSQSEYNEDYPYIRKNYEDDDLSDGADDNYHSEAGNDRKEGEKPHNQFWKHRHKYRFAHIKHDFTKMPLTDEERLNITLERAADFNLQLLKKRVKIKEQIKGLNSEKIWDRVHLDNINLQFPSSSVPLYIADDAGNLFYDSNNALTVSRNTIENFIEINLKNENNKSYNDTYMRYANYHHRRTGKKKKFIDND